MHTAHLLNNETFHIERLLYVPLTKQPPLYLRPHSLVPSGAAIGLLTQRVEQAGTGLLTPNLISDVSKEILRPSTVAYDTIINHGWMAQDRFVFILKVVSTGLGGEVNTYIQGYTNCAEINTTGMHATASHDLVHHVSSVIETTVSHIPGPMGYVRHEKLSRVYDVITDDSIDGIDLQRPSDIIDNIKSRAVANSVKAFGDYVDDPYFMTEVVNASSHMNRFSKRAETSKMDNNISSVYLVNVINEGVKDQKNKDYIYETDIDFTYNNDDYSNTETILGRNRFLAYITAIAGYQSARAQFTFNDLLMVDANGANNFEIGNLMPDTFVDAFNQTPHQGGGEYWNLQDPTTPVAHSLIQAAISFTAKYGFSMAVIHIDNTFSPIVDISSVVISDAYSYLNVGDRDKQILLESLRSKFFYEVFLVETNNGSIPLSADIYVDLIGDSKIRIRYGYEPDTWYTLPTVANNHISPTISKDVNHYAETTSMFSTFIDEVSDVVKKNDGLVSPGVMSHDQITQGYDNPPPRIYY